MGYVYIMAAHTHGKHAVRGMTDFYISAWASALLVQTISGNAKASECRDGQQVQTPALFLYASNPSYLPTRRPREPVGAKHTMQ